MQELFCRVIEISLKGGFCIGVILPVRLLLVKLGRKYAYYLWIVVFFHLIVPFTIQSRFSLIPKQAAEFSVEMDAGSDQLVLRTKLFRPDDLSILQPENGQWADAIPQSESKQSTDVIRQAGGSQQTGSMQQPEGGRQKETEYRSNGIFSGTVLLYVWLSGFFAVIIFNMVHVFLVKRQISPDKWIHWEDKGRIAEVRGLPSPFLWGIIRPIIFLPPGLEEKERDFIILHENCHRRRGDCVWKLVAYAAVALHWFNPAVWAAWILYCRDMEISCDEAVLAGTGKEIRSRYAQSLLRYAAGQNGYLMAPPTFGEPSARTRIKNVLYFQEHGRLSGPAAGCIMILAVFGLTVHPVEIEELPDLTGYVNNIVVRYSSVTEAVGNGIREGMTDADETSDTTESGKYAGAEDTAADMYFAEPVADMDSGDDRTDIWHREGYVEAEVVHISDLFYDTPGPWDEEELDALAQRALQELYDLTGTQIVSCVYCCNDLGMFFFSKTEEDLRHSRNFYRRDYGEKEGYGSNLIACMDIVSARRFWFSDVQQLDIPAETEEMEEEELAVWFLQRSGVYQGEEIVSAEPSPDPEAVRIVTANGSFYEVTLDMPIRAVSSIYGPYPEGVFH